ncbi:MAG: VIT1/CCC1 transporter family protein [bacterium]
MTAAEVHHQHRDVSGGWLRPAVFGATDGLVSNFALIAGVAGSNVAAHTVTLAGLAGLVGGAFSMATGEYISVRSQNESMAAEIEVERRELHINPHAEMQELAQLFASRGVDVDLAGRVAAQISRNPERALDVHAREELGVNPSALPDPWVAAISSLLFFAVGALVPLVPYLVGVTSVWTSAVLALGALFLTGAVTSRFTTRTWWYSGVRQMAVGAAAALVTSLIGRGFGS